MNDITFSKLLSSVMLDNKYDRFVKNRRTGKLDTKGLHRISTSSKLFKKREARLNKHYAVSIVVDASGSMQTNSKHKVAAEAAQKISEHLGRIGINHNVITFAGHIEVVKPFSVNSSKEIRREIVKNVDYSKRLVFKEVDGKSFIYSFYGFSEDAKKVTDIKGRYVGEFLLRSEGGDCFTERSCGWNSDAEAIKYTRGELHKQVGKKIAIVLSDGQPVPLPSEFESPINLGYNQKQFDLKREIKMTIDSGIELYSIGILDDSVNKFYPAKRTCVIRDLNQLYPHIIKLIKINLKRG